MGSSAINYSGSAGGRLVQLVKYETGVYASGVVNMVQDNSKPQNTEGDQYLELDITPTNAANILEIDVLLNVSNTTGGQCIAALFQDDAVDAIAVGANLQAGADFNQVKIKHYMVASGVVPTTFKVRAGSVAGGMTDFNGRNSAPYFDEAFASSIAIAEIGPGIGGGDTPTYQ